MKYYFEFVLFILHWIYVFLFFSWDVFTEGSDGKCIPKCIFIDSEPSCIDAVRNGKFKNLFDEDSHFVMGNHDGVTEIYF